MPKKDFEKERKRIDDLTKRILENTKKVNPSPVVAHIVSCFVLANKTEKELDAVRQYQEAIAFDVSGNDEKGGIKK